MRLAAGLVAIAVLGVPGVPSAQTASGPSDHRALIGRYCVTCHNERLETAGLNLDGLDVTTVGEHPEVWEKVVRKLRTGTMPPPARPQPRAAARDALAAWLEVSLDAEAVSRPNPGRTDTLRRLNRTEYQNSIRDLLALDIDAALLLPPDESGYGFDNVTVSDLSPVLLDRYLSAAQKISRLAVGSTQTSLQSEVIRVASDVTQEAHVARPAHWDAGWDRRPVHVHPGRRVRHSDSARAKSCRVRRRFAGARCAPPGTAARSRAGQDVHGGEAARG